MATLTTDRFERKTFENGVVKVKFFSETITTSGMELEHQGGKPVASINIKDEDGKTRDISFENKPAAQNTVVILNSNRELPNAEINLTCE